jgi:hypothetical protein
VNAARQLTSLKTLNDFRQLAGYCGSHATADRKRRAFSLSLLSRPANRAALVVDATILDPFQFLKKFRLQNQSDLLRKSHLD